MIGDMKLVFLAVAVLATFSTGDALRCWSCSSDMDAPCADFFNSTQYERYARYPQSGHNAVTLQDCDQSTSSFYSNHNNQNQKAVCMKKKQTTYGRTTYIRQCRFLHFEERVGKCPTETTSSATTIDFCEYCDHDGCNGATTMQLTIFLPLIMSLLAILFSNK